MQAVSNFGALERCECAGPSNSNSRVGVGLKGSTLPYTHTYKNGKDSIGLTQ